MRISRTDKAGPKKKGHGRSQAFYIDRVVYEQITKLAEADDRSNSYIVNKILKEYFIKKKMIEKY